MAASADEGLAMVTGVTALVIWWGSRKGRAGTVGAKGKAVLATRGAAARDVDLTRGLDFLVGMPRSFPWWQASWDIVSRAWVQKIRDNRIERRIPESQGKGINLARFDRSAH